MPKGDAKYGENETEDTVYEHPEGICSGRYGLRYIWPTVNDRTSIMIELDSRKAAQDKSECTLSIFYESLKFPVDPAHPPNSTSRCSAHTWCVFL